MVGPSSVEGINKELPNLPGVYCLIHKPTGHTYFAYAEVSLYQTAKGWPRALRNPQKYGYVSAYLEAFILQHGSANWQFQCVPGATEEDKNSAIEAFKVAHPGLCLNNPAGRPRTGMSPTIVIGDLVGVITMHHRPPLAQAMANWPIDDRWRPVRHATFDIAGALSFPSFVFIACWTDAADDTGRNAHPSTHIVRELWKLWVERVKARDPAIDLPVDGPADLLDIFNMPVPSWARNTWHRKKI